MSEAKKRPCPHCLVETVTGEELCATCGGLPRCQVCEVFFDGLVPQSEENPKRCVSCIDFEDNIKLRCFICVNPIPLYISRRSNVLRYVAKGNVCDTCNAESRRNGLESKKTDDKEQFVGYLALIEPLYAAGVLTEDRWRRAVRRNRHDVTRWDGIEELMQDEEELEVVGQTI